jgi:hypothetical protein
MAAAPARSLDDQLAEFRRHRFLAMPIAGTIAWALIGVAGAVLPEPQAALALFVLTGSIFGLGVLVGRLIGEDLLGRDRPPNAFDRLFLSTVVMANLGWAVVIPFFMVEPDSLPLGVGVLAGMMWVPFSWMLGHWVGLFHGLARTVLVLAAWLAFPDRRFVAVPAVIVALYLVSIYALATRRIEPAPAPTAA